MRTPGGLRTQHATVIRKSRGVRELGRYSKCKIHSQGLSDATSYEIRFQQMQKDTFLGEDTHPIYSNHVYEFPQPVCSYWGTDTK